MPEPTINKQKKKKKQTKKQRIAYLESQIKQAIESLAKERQLLTNAKLNIITSASLPIDIHEMLVMTAEERLRTLREQLGSISNRWDKKAILPPCHVCGKRRAVITDKITGFTTATDCDC